MAEWFEAWFNTPYYHKLYVERDEQEAAAFITKLIDYLKPEPGARMLDIACGKGRHAKQLADAGYDVTGIDISPDSITEAQLLEHDQLRFYVHDMRLPFLINYFQFAFNFFTSFGYFRTRREHSNAIRTIAQSLQQGGKFLIDYLNTPYVAERLVPAETKTIGTTVYGIKRWLADAHFYKEITVTDPALPTPMTFTERVAAFSKEDLTGMLHKHGLVVTDVFGDYLFNDWNEPHSPRLILIAEKQ